MPLSLTCRLGTLAITLAALVNPLSILGRFLPVPSVRAAEASQPLLQQVQQCIQQKSAAQGLSPQKNSQAAQPGFQKIAEGCFFSVVMLNPDGSVRPDASERMASMLRQTGTQMPHPKGQGQAVVPIQTQSGRLYKVPVTVQQRRFNFLVDTGASNTVIDHQTARKLGIKGKATAANLLGYLAVGGQPSRQAPVIYSLPPIHLGQATVTQLVGIGLSLQQPPFQSDGILGLDFLSQFDLLINPKTQSLSLQRPSSPTAAGMPLFGKLGVMTLSGVTINGKGSYTFLLDTGAAVTTLSEGLAQRLGLKFDQGSAVAVFGLSGQNSARWSQLSALTLQNHRLSNQMVLVTNSQVFQTIGVDGVIGQDVLSQYRQHWRFGPPGPLGTPECGSLELTPLSASIR